MEKSTKIYLLLVIILAACSAINVFLSQGNLVASTPLPASKAVMALVVFPMVILIYGGLGFVGLKLSKKLGFAGLWDKKVSNRQRFLIPLAIGVGSGIVLIVMDLVFSPFNSIGRIPHPPFPTSIFASISAGIGEEIIFRLFMISFVVWLVSSVILRKKDKNQVFWGAAVGSATVFAIGHVPSLMLLLGMKSIAQFPPVLMAEIILLNGLISILAAYYLRKYGFLAAAGIHFWTDIVWHVVYGIIYNSGWCSCPAGCASPERPIIHVTMFPLSSSSTCLLSRYSYPASS
jgi:hypothetical protein